MASKKVEDMSELEMLQEMTERSRDSVRFSSFIILFFAQLTIDVVILAAIFAN